MATSGLSYTRKVWLVFAAASIAVATVAALLAGEAAYKGAEAKLAQEAEAAAALHAAVLRSDLEKHRSLPLALASDPDAAQLLRKPTPAGAERLNLKLEELSSQARAAAIYLLNDKGLTLAASNWRLPTSFVGSNYGFRPYFTKAMQFGTAEFFALGTVSGRPGLYLARRIGPERAPLGVIVVKVEFDELEAEWRASGEPAYVVDPGGVVLVTSEPAWRFRTTKPLDEARRRLTIMDQTLAQEALHPLPFLTPDSDSPALLKASNGRAVKAWMHAQTGAAAPGWTLHLLEPASATLEEARVSAQIFAIMLVALGAGGAALLLRRRLQAAIKARAEEEARIDLERRIDERTHELLEANLALSLQIEERQRAEAMRELLRDELVQASKLAALGQIAAGVAHEINQPVAAILTHAETAQAYIQRNQPDGATGALQRIGTLTQRIGAITQELRTFARKSEPKLEAVRLEEAINGALLLLEGPLHDSSVRLERGACHGICVLADRFRLEQVIINLVQNAANALEHTQDAQITLSAKHEGNRVTLIVADNGPGVPAEVQDRLFVPFTTTRPSGLGLGLVICRDIVVAFGGELNLLPSDRGAQFALVLRAA